MIRKIVQCDVCKKQEDLSVFEPHIYPALPNGWYRVTGGGEEKHYCSKNCMGTAYRNGDKQ